MLMASSFIQAGFVIHSKTTFAFLRSYFRSVRRILGRRGGIMFV